MSTCTHKATSLGEMYEYCEDCGAVRRHSGPRSLPDPWHSCDTCRIPVDSLSKQDYKRS